MERSYLSWRGLGDGEAALVVICYSLSLRLSLSSSFWHTFTSPSPVPPSTAWNTSGINGHGTASCELRFNAIPAVTPFSSSSARVRGFQAWWLSLLLGQRRRRRRKKKWPWRCLRIAPSRYREGEEWVVLLMMMLFPIHLLKPWICSLLPPNDYPLAWSNMASIRCARENSFHAAFFK